MTGNIAFQDDVLSKFFIAVVTFLISNSNKNFSITKKHKLKLLRYFYAKLRLCVLNSFTPK